MQKAIDISKRISKDLKKNWFIDLEDVNLHKEFEGLYKMNVSLETANTIVCFIINAYDPDSGWIDLRKDRHEDKLRILKGLGGSYSHEIFKQMLEGDNDIINDAISNYLEIVTDYRFTMVLDFFQSSSNELRYLRSRRDTKRKIDVDEESGEDVFEDLDYEKEIKAREGRNKLYDRARKLRETGEEILALIKKDYVKTDHATQQDFGFVITDIEKIDPTSWRQYIKKRNKEKATN